MVLPSDNEIRAMSPAEQDAIFRSLQTDDEREEFSDALLRLQQAHRVGAHSERTDTRRRRRQQGECLFTADLAPAMSAIDEHELQQMLLTLAGEGLTKRQQQVWFLCDYMGYKQREAAEILGLRQQSSVSRTLARAEFALMRRAKMDGVAIQLLRESGRRGYFAPGHRPEVPELVQAHRQVIEQQDGVITVIIDMDKQSVEIWDTNQREVIRDDRRLPDARVSFYKAKKLAMRSASEEFASN